MSASEVGRKHARRLFASSHQGQRKAAAAIRRLTGSGAGGTQLLQFNIKTTRGG